VRSRDEEGIISNTTSNSDRAGKNTGSSSHGRTNRPPARAGHSWMEGRDGGVLFLVRDVCTLSRVVDEAGSRFAKRAQTVAMSEGGLGRTKRNSRIHFDWPPWPQGSAAEGKRLV